MHVLNYQRIWFLHSLTSGRKAAMGLLEALDFEKLTAEAAAAEPEAKAEAGASKKAKKPE